MIQNIFSEKKAGVSKNNLKKYFVAPERRGGEEEEEDQHIFAQSKKKKKQNVSLTTQSAATSQRSNKPKKQLKNPLTLSLYDQWMIFSTQSEVLDIADNEEFFQHPTYQTMTEHPTRRIFIRVSGVRESTKRTCVRERGERKKKRKKKKKKNKISTTKTKKKK